MNILQGLDDPAIFAPHFQRGDWSAWRAFLAALFALPMTDEQRAIFEECTARTTPPATPASEAWLICGRRAGKSFVLATIGVFLASFRDYRPHLQPGERATVMILAADKRQARVIKRYCEGLLTEIPMLAQTIDSISGEEIQLNSRVSIEIHAASFRSTRGYTMAAVLADEVAFWRSDESANPDKEILNALRPGMASIPGALLLCASSPYARRGALWDEYRRSYGKESEVLVWQAPTRRMNPTVPQSLIDRALEEDPAAAGAEYMAQFRTDVEAYLAREVVEGLVSPGVHELPPVEGVRYFGFVDPSGGSKDAMTLAVSHLEGETRVLDAVREVKPPFSPESVVADFAALLKTYRISTVVGDRYAGEWPREQFRKLGIEYRTADRPRSDLYRDLLPLANSGRLALLDNPRLVTQLVSLERRTSRAGKDSIDHPPNGHDDLANAAAGALILATPRERRTVQLAIGGERAGRLGASMGPISQDLGAPPASL
ncbi:hypothetical protein [Roseospirillum parvum]|uniref:Phage terminase-like protein, large subunit, contains N-terminal HTH domain n=1 Tax=Roseospirillum parvum TaxID=83401 RepID=A0A1G8E6Q7_9PROT|nr:hypothetical protein [Roseospirillum parvum]SDH65616.1 hypothetical protein SAMN05421742_10954 [Roseospirillum parvum]